EFVAALPKRQSSRQIAGHDFTAPAIDDIEPNQKNAADQDAADQSEEHHQQHRPGQRSTEETFGLVALRNVARDEQFKTAGQGEFASACPPLFWMSADTAFVIELDEIVAGIREIRPGVEIAHDRA